MSKILETIGIILAAVAAVAAVVFLFNIAHCNPIENVLKSLVPSVAVAPVTAIVQPGDTLEFAKNSVKIIPGKRPAVPGAKPTAEPTPWVIRHPVEFKPRLVGGRLVVQQSGFCLVPLAGARWRLDSAVHWEVGARVFAAGQAGFEPSFSDREWSPRLDLRPFDGNVLLGAGPDFKALSLECLGASFSAKFDFGF